MKRVKLRLEFIFKASPSILYEFLTSPATLTRWFCDEVDVTDDIFTFSWNGSIETAFLLEDVEEEYLKFQWEHAETPSEFLEFRISKSPVTEETILEITDYCDANEVKDARHLWESQMKSLRKETGG